MGPNKLSWKFVNEQNSSETIIVYDEQSASCVTALIKKTGGKWAIAKSKDASVAQTSNPAPAMTPKVANEANVQPTPPPFSKTESTPPPAKNAQPPEKELRTHERHSREFRVILISGNRSFRSSSENISVGGMRLKKNVPDSFIQDQCTVYVSHQDLQENLELICQVIQDPEDSRRIRFLNPDANQIKRLQEWLTEKNGKKSAA